MLLQGKDFRAWGSGAFDEALATINAQPARARIGLQIRSLEEKYFEVVASAELVDVALARDAALYLAAYESRIVSRVTAGENRGRTLEHDYVVLEWQGPFDFGQQPRLEERHVLPLLPAGVPASSGIVGFVQNRRTAEVLQALMLPACKG